jgi:hypothetical protein
MRAGDIEALRSASDNRAGGNVAHWRACGHYKPVEWCGPSLPLMLALLLIVRVAGVIPILTPCRAEAAVEFSLAP